MESWCQYIEYAVAYSRQGVFIQVNALRNATQILGFGRILWIKDLRYGTWTRDLVPITLGRR
jgi:hypothetical protein